MWSHFNNLTGIELSGSKLHNFPGIVGTLKNTKSFDSIHRAHCGKETQQQKNKSKCNILKYLYDLLTFLKTKQQTLINNGSAYLVIFD